MPQESIRIVIYFADQGGSLIYSPWIPHQPVRSIVTVIFRLELSDGLPCDIFQHTHTSLYFILIHPNNRVSVTSEIIG